MYDLIIVGAGPAGLTAALYAARKKINTLLLTKDLGGQVMWTKDIENYMGYQFITGQELINKFENQLKPLLSNDSIRYEAVTGLETGDGDLVVTTTRAAYKTKSIIIASGKRPRPLGVPGEVEFRGRGVSYCATCDGPLFRNKTVAVIGGGNSALQAALELSRIAEKVYLADRSGYKAEAMIIDKVKQTPNIIPLHNYETKAIVGDKVVKELVMVNGNSNEECFSVQGIFVEIGLLPNTEFLSGSLPLNDNKEVIVNCRCGTDIPGVFAAGDVTNSVDKQIVIAAGEGAKAAIAVNEYLFQLV